MRAHIQCPGLSHTENRPYRPHRPQSMFFYSPAPCRQKQDFSTGRFEIWGSKEQSMTTTNFINGTGPRVWSLERRRRRKDILSPLPIAQKLSSSVQGGIYALGKAHMRSTSSLRSSPNVAFETVQNVGGLIDDGLFSSSQGRSLSASSFLRLSHPQKLCENPRPPVLCCDNFDRAVFKDKRVMD